MLPSVSSREEALMAQKNDKPAVAAFGLEVHEQTESPRDGARQRFWQAVARIRTRNADKDADEVLQDVTEEVEESARSAMSERAAPRAVDNINLFVSGLISPRGQPGDLLDAWRAGRFELLISDRQLTEIEDVFHPPQDRPQLPPQTE